MSGNHASSILALWVGCSFSFITWAEKISYLEEPIVVTASRTDQTMEDTLASATISHVMKLSASKPAP